VESPGVDSTSSAMFPPNKRAAAPDARLAGH
jgi:hypothetical protein